MVVCVFRSDDFLCVMLAIALVIIIVTLHNVIRFSHYHVSHRQLSSVSSSYHHISRTLIFARLS